MRSRHVGASLHAPWRDGSACGVEVVTHAAVQQSANAARIPRHESVGFINRAPAALDHVVARLRAGLAFGACAEDGEHVVRLMQPLAQREQLADDDLKASLLASLTNCRLLKRLSWLAGTAREPPSIDPAVRTDRVDEQHFPITLDQRLRDIDPSEPLHGLGRYALRWNIGGEREISAAAASSGRTFTSAAMGEGGDYLDAFVGVRERAVVPCRAPHRHASPAGGLVANTWRAGGGDYHAREVRSLFGAPQLQRTCSAPEYRERS
jgi:hypothetical protein